MSRLQEFKNEFSSREGIHFNSAGRTPLPRTAAERLVKFVTDGQLHASLRDQDLFEMLVRARKNLARFLDADVESVAFVPNVATALSQAALGFPLKVGDEVVVLDQEYASNFYPWSEACSRAGAKLKVISSGESGSVEFASGDQLSEKVMAAIQPGVKIVAVSWVQFQTGAVLDLKKIGDRAHAVGAYLVVDGIQGLGQLPFSFHDLPVDFVAGGAHKWMCGMVGQGFLAAKKDFMSLLVPTVVGCGTFNRFGSFADQSAPMENSARKFEPGAFSFSALLALDSAIEVLMAPGMEVIAEEIARLSQIFRRGLIELGEGGSPGFKMVSPMNQPSGITSFILPKELEEKFIKTCKDSSVALIKRGDFIRVSIHAFNSEEEVDRVLDLLRLNQIS